MKTVQEVFFDVARRLGLTTIFGNPGSTEETLLKNFPTDFRYVLALQEAPAVATDHHGWPADSRDAAARALSHQHSAARNPETVREMGIRAGQTTGCTGRTDARLRHGRAASGRAGFFVDTHG